MKNNIFSITGGICGVLIGAEVMELAVQLTGTIILAFIGGIAGVLGKKFCDYIFRILKKKE